MCFCFLGMRSTVLVVLLLIRCSIIILATPISSRDDTGATFDDDSMFAMQPCPSRCIAAQGTARHNIVRSADSHSSTYDAPEVSAARIFYLILVHNERTANDAVFLFRAIRDPRNTVAIHFDRKVAHLLHQNTSKSTLLQEVEECPCGSHVYVDSVHAVEWSKWSMNQPTLWGMELAVSSMYEWDVFINLSGDTLPVFTPNTMAQQVANLTRHYNFVTSRSCETGLVPTSVNQFPKFWHKRRHYTRDETEPDPVFTYTTAINKPRSLSRRSTNVSQQLPQQNWHTKTLTIHFGSQWVILRRSFVKWLVRQLGDESSWPSQFREYLIQSQMLMTDETFIPTILMHANNDDGDSEDFTGTVPVLSTGTKRLTYLGVASSSNEMDVPAVRHVRFERMDEHMPTSNGVFPETQRYQVPESLVESNQLEQPKVWGPYFLGVYDLSAIRESGALFVRKVSALVDANLVHLLPVDNARDIPNIRWPKDGEISLTSRPDWDSELERLEEYRTQRQRRSKQTGDDSTMVPETDEEL